MTLHLIKLCVGIESLHQLQAVQARRLKELAEQGRITELCHKTMQMPRRRSELLDGGSLYWVIKGFISARQKIVDLKQTTREDGRACCGIVLDRGLVETEARPRRPFQGWRYLEDAEAPPDLGVLKGELAEMPPGMREELRTLRLID